MPSSSKMLPKHIEQNRVHPSQINPCDWCSGFKPNDRHVTHASLEVQYLFGGRGIPSNKAGAEGVEDGGVAEGGIEAQEF